MIVSDNGKMIKSASKIIQGVFNEPEMKKYFSELHVEWTFNLKKATMLGDIFERMIKSEKRCLKKPVGRTSLTYDDFSTFMTKMQGVLSKGGYS